MDFLPLFFDLKDKACLVVGGGAIAQRKAGLLQRAGAIIRVVAPSVNEELVAIAIASGGEVLLRQCQACDLPGHALVIAATDDAKVNRMVSEEAHISSIPVNVVDNPDLCSVILPSIVDRSPLIIAISSGGRSPILTRLLRTRIETMVPAAYGRLANFVGDFRDAVRHRVTGLRARRIFWENTLQGPVAEMVLAGRESEGRELLERLIEEADPEKTVGEVYLIGAGPGDPDLLTFRALRLMQSADIVFYDRLVSPQIVDLSRRDAERVYVGKSRSRHPVPQQEINQLLIDHAKQGKRVVRLKGGDPFIFGRGGEEIEGLARERIPFQVIPGITAASGCACYAGIPLTHRDYSQAVRFVTGHLKDGSSQLNWSELTSSDETIVFYMGLFGLPIICSKLIEHGSSKDMPVALIEQGTTARQRVITGTLETLPALVAAVEVHAPTLIIVGEVVKLRAELAWFNEIPHAV